MNYIQLSWIIGDGEERERLIAGLSAAGAEAFEEGEEILKAVFDEHAFDAAAVDTLALAFGLRYEQERILPQNWNAAWEASFEPVTVPGFCTIRADFHRSDHSVAHEIIITPKMSFGTGHHATTRLMIQAMRELSFDGKSVLDFGTGTGILAILAEKLRADEVWAIDNDAWSVENSEENINANDTLGIHILEGSLEVVDGKLFDVILANINRHVLLAYMAAMRKLLPDDGCLVVSGILTEDEAIVTAAARDNAFRKINVSSEGNWICVVFTALRPA